MASICGGERERAKGSEREHPLYRIDLGKGVGHVIAPARDDVEGRGKGDVSFIVDPIILSATDVVSRTTEERTGENQRIQMQG